MDECDQCPPSCLIPEFTAECTNECLVLACDDPNHGQQACQVTDGGISCDGTCITAAACNDCTGLEEILQCCTDYHYWQSAFPAFPCDCAHQSIHALISDPSIPSSSSSSSPSLPPFSPQLHHPSHFPCMWANCNSTYNSLSDLVGHVNLHHLCTMDTSSSLPLPAFPQPLSCHWGDCAMYPSLSSIPSSSSPSSEDDVLNILTTHLMQDHLGLSLPSPPSVLPQPPHDTFDPVYQPPCPSSHDCSGTHVCKWKTCSETFLSCDDLTAHIAAVHVGGGKAHYECFWEGCTRHGTRGFSSKQKISRHLQSHTGHRPFQCQVCNQNFSEAATLQQHMRRHTQEKPYVCDFPGCSKAFSITGALTIHKRTHNGSRPFKCKFCDKAFSESSNLSKHLRTHTGARPYVCAEEACRKAFARPDQLARHMNVHRRKKESKG